MADLEALIKQSVDTATETGDVPAPMDGEDAVASEPVAEPAEPSEPAEPAEPVAAKPAEEKKDEPATADADAEILKILEDAGIKPPQPGKDNRIPHSRVVKIIGNALKKRIDAISTEHNTTLQSRDTRIEALQSALDRFSEIEKRIAADPESYILSLAAINPKYRKFVSGQVADVVAQDKPTTDASDPKPEPDLKFTDGTTGFSPDQWEKREAWNRRQGAREAAEIVRRDLEKQYKPLLEDRAALQTRQRLTATINNSINRAKQQWGAQLYIDNEKAIADAVNAETANARRERREPVPFDSIVASILVPVMQKRIDNQRELVLKEMKTAPKAASSRTTGQTKPTPEPAEERSTFDVIKDAIESSGIRG